MTILLEGSRWRAGSPAFLSRHILPSRGYLEMTYGSAPNILFRALFSRNEGVAY